MAQVLKHPSGKSNHPSVGRKNHHVDTFKTQHASLTLPSPGKDGRNFRLHRPATVSAQSSTLDMPVTTRARSSFVPQQTAPAVCHKPHHHRPSHCSPILEASEPLSFLPQPCPCAHRARHGVHLAHSCYQIWQRKLEPA